MLPYERRNLDRVASTDIARTGTRSRTGLGGAMKENP